MNLACSHWFSSFLLLIFVLNNVKIYSQKTGNTSGGLKMKKPTIKDIAAAAGVSPASVSMILNGRNLSRFTEQTIQNVYRASRQMGYLPKRQQRHKNPRETILIVCPSLMNPYYSILIQSMEQEARLRGYMTMIFTTYWDKAAEREILEMSLG